MRAQLEREYSSFVSCIHHLPYTPRIPRNISRPPREHVPVTSFSRSLGRKVTVYVRVYAPPETKCSLLATFCSRILLIWQYTSIRHFPKFATFSGSERLAVLNFYTSKTLNIGCSLALRARGRARYTSLYASLHRLVRFRAVCKGRAFPMRFEKGDGIGS